MEVIMTNKTGAGRKRSASARPENGSQRPTLEAMVEVAARTDTEEKLRLAMLGNPNRNANDLAGVAGIGRSTAAKILAKWAAEGAVTRTPGIAQGGRRAADLWALNNVAPAIDNAPGSEAMVSSAALDDTDDGAATARSESDKETGGDSQPANDHKQQPSRLAKGALRGLVEDFLRDHPGQDFSPSRIGKELNRSSGAVHNALEKLAAAGYALRTSDKPKRFRVAEGGKKTNPETPSNG